MLNDHRQRLRKYAILTIGCGMFSIIYEHFSHQVYSHFMVFLFLIPLILGVLPQLLSIWTTSRYQAGSWQHLIHNFAVATLISASTLQGIIEIYGTSSHLLVYYWIAGCGLLATSIVMSGLHLLAKSNSMN